MNHIDLDTITLGKGKHATPGEGACVMEAVSLYAHEDWSDTPACVDPVLRSIAIRINDTVDDESRQRLKPYIFKLVGTAGQSRATHEKMAFLAADRAIHVFAPMALRARGREADALTLERLPEIVDKATAEQARIAAREITSAAYDYTAASAASSASAASAASASAAKAAKAANAAAAAASASDHKAHINDERFRLLDDLIALCVPKGA